MTIEIKGTVPALAALYEALHSDPKPMTPSLSSRARADAAIVTYLKQLDYEEWIHKLRTVSSQRWGQTSPSNKAFHTTVKSCRSHAGAFKVSRKVFLFELELVWVCVVVHVRVVCVFIGTTSVGLLESPQGAGAHVNEGSCWTGLLLLPPPPFSLFLPSCSLPPLCPLVRWGVLTSQSLLQGHKGPMWSQLLQLLSLQLTLQPHTFLDHIFPTCSSFDLLFSIPSLPFHSSLWHSFNAHSAFHCSVFSLLSCVEFLLLQQFGFYMCHTGLLKTLLLTQLGETKSGEFLTIPCAPQGAQTVAVGRRL